MTNRDKRLNALRRKFKAIWKERDRMGLVIKMAHADRHKGQEGRYDLMIRMRNSFVTRWRLEQESFAVWCGVMEDFPHAEPLEIEFAAKLANRIIVQENQMARRKKRCVSPLERWNGGKGAA